MLQEDHGKCAVTSWMVFVDLETAVATYTNEEMVHHISTMI